MAILSSDHKSVTVQKGDTLSEIAVTYKSYSNNATYQQLATINKIPNPDLIYIGQVIKLVKDSSSTDDKADATKVTVKQFGLQADLDNELFVTWSWGKSSQTEGYQVRWDYYTDNKFWFTGSETSDTKYMFSTYSIPSNAKQVRVRIKPISKKYKSGNIEKTYFTGSWCAWQKHTVARLPDAPPTPSVELTDDLKLTASLENLDEENADIIYFEVTKNDATVAHSGKAAIVTGKASKQWTVKAGGRYKVRCYAIKDDTLKSEWSQYTNNLETIPAVPGKLTKCEAALDESILLEWSSVENATSYDIEYTNDRTNFDKSSSTTTQSGIETTQWKLTGIETGKEYHFRVRAVNSKASSEVKYSGWSEISSITIGKGPAAPSTWSSTTTAINDETLTLYWVHNSRDGSSQTYAELELTINGQTETHTITNSTDEDEKDKTSSWPFPMVDNDGDPYYEEGAQLQWRVRTAGVTKTYGDWSVVRVVDIYAKPTLELTVTNYKDEAFETLESFPIDISAVAYPKTQTPIGYHLSVIADGPYETVDNLGNRKYVNAGDAVYSKYFDINTDLQTSISAGEVSLENGESYTISCIVSMNSGLAATATQPFAVSWGSVSYAPNAEIGINPDTLSASIRPYCARYSNKYLKVTPTGSGYEATTESLGYISGTIIDDVRTTTGEQVYEGWTADGVRVYYCESIDETVIEDVLLAVYRREYDGTFTEVESGIDGSKYTTVTDPHPALDYARYRIVATSKTTGEITYYDMPEYPVGGKSVVIQWDEVWTNVETPVGNDELSEASWTGSMVKLPYNIDVSSNHKQDVELVEYIGRRHPVSYYGTQVGESGTWNVDIEADDVETLYALRRLAIWMGNAYVREPSGSGYWASVSVSFSKKHNSLTIPVTINITRVEGGK